jgi:hypothetical protein
MNSETDMNLDTQAPHDILAKRKLRTGLVLASVALVFFFGFILRAWVLNQ